MMADANILHNWPRPWMFTEAHTSVDGYGQWECKLIRFIGWSGFFKGVHGARFTLIAELERFLSSSRKSPLVTEKQRSFIWDQEWKGDKAEAAMAWFMARNAIESFGTPEAIAMIAQLHGTPWVSSDGHEVGPWPESIRMGYNIRNEFEPPYKSTMVFFAPRDADAKTLAFMDSAVRSLVAWSRKNEDAISDVVKAELIALGEPPKDSKDVAVWG